MSACNIVILLLMLSLCGAFGWILYLDSLCTDMRGYINKIDGNLDEFQEQR